MSEHDDEETTAEPEESGEDDLLAAQEGKGYGEDEGEREQSLPDD